MFTTILKLLLISLIPICVTIAIILLNKFTKLNNVRGWKWHILIGLIFGGISILGTVLGVTTESGAVINIRDSAPICAGLIFGGPAGIIAGFIIEFRPLEKTIFILIDDFNVLVPII